MKKYQFIAWFEEIDKNDIGTVGGKGANLGEMFKAKIPVPYGFVITSQSYFRFIKETGLEKKIRYQLRNLDHHNSNLLNSIAKNIQKLILHERIPEDIAREIIFAYTELAARSKAKLKFLQKLSALLKNPLVAVRSSATAEDLPGASFAGQQDTYLNVSGEANVLKKVHKSWASLFTPRAIFYREEQKFDHMKVGIASVVQIMVASESSGVMFTVDPVTNDKAKITIEAILGLGELIVQGSVTPDHYELKKDDLSILVRQIGDQNKKMIKKGIDNAEVRLSKAERSKQKISDEKIREVAALGKKLEKYYYFPQDIEWAVEKGQVFIVQTRPITTYIKVKKTDGAPSKGLAEANLKLLLKGDPASPGIKTGPVKIIYKAGEIDKVMPGDVLVTVQTNPDFVPAMKKAVAIVTERGGRTSHAAIVSRELGIPAVVGTGNVTKVLKTGQVVTVDGAKGEIYEGAFAGQLQVLKEKDIKTPRKELKTATKVYVNLATPNRVEEVSKMNADGIGLL